MSVYLDYNAKFTSGAFNAKDSFLYSSGVINHINLNYLTSTFVTGTLGLGAATISGGTNGAVMLNGLLILLDNNIQLLTGSIPNTACPISIAITQQDNTPYFAYYPYGVVPSNYVKMATYLQQYRSWVYEPVVGPTRALIKNSWGYKDFYPVASTTGLALFGGEGYIYSDYVLSSTTASVDARCGISITGTYPIPTGSGSSYFEYDTQLVLEPFTKTFLNVPVKSTRTTQNFALPSLASSTTYGMRAIPGPLITGSSGNAESLIASVLVSPSTTQWSIWGIAISSSISYVTGTTAYVLSGSAPVLVPSLDPSGHKWMYLDASGYLNVYNVSLSNNFTLTSSQIIPSYTGFTGTNISAVSLGALTFIMLQNGSNIDLMTLVGSVSSTLWPEVRLTINGLTSTAQLLVDRQAIAHILFISGTSLLSYNYPLGTGAPSGTISYLAPARIFGSAQNVAGDSIIVISNYINPTGTYYHYYSINFSPFTYLTSTIPLSSIYAMQVNADLTSFGIVPRVSAPSSSYFLCSIDGHPYFQGYLSTNYLIPVMGTISPMILYPGGFLAYPLPRVTTNLPAVLQYRFNPNAYPSPTSEIVHPNEFNNESRMNTALDLNGRIRPQTISSTNLYVTGDNGNWYQIRVGLDGSLYASTS